MVDHETVQRKMREECVLTVLDVQGLLIGAPDGMPRMYAGETCLEFRERVQAYCLLEEPGHDAKVSGGRRLLLAMLLRPLRWVVMTVRRFLGV